MAKAIRYSITFLGTIPLDANDNPSDNEIQRMIADDFYNITSGDIGYANDVEFEVEEV